MFASGQEKLGMDEEDLIKAVKEGNYEAIERLLDGGVNPNTRDEVRDDTMTLACHVVAIRRGRLFSSGLASTVSQIRFGCFWIEEPTP